MALLAEKCATLLKSRRVYSDFCTADQLHLQTSYLYILHENFCSNRTAPLTVKHGPALKARLIAWPCIPGTTQYDEMGKPLMGGEEEPVENYCTIMDGVDIMPEQESEPDTLPPYSPSPPLGTT